jgi:NAD-dependent SIR2 family protein deacetylase
MPQVFPRWTNAVSRVTLLGAAATAPLLLWFCLMYVRSSYGTDAGVVREQPIPFSHEHHAGVLAIDCRYCHQSVETSSYAGMPATKTCMNCHSQIWVGAEMLQPVRTSYADDRPLHWDRVYNLPGFVYFDHSVHVQHGVGCSTCHGEVNRMPLTYQMPSLLMEWCLDCHRAPQDHLRPRDLVFDMNYQPPEDQDALGQKLLQEYEIASAATLTSCSTCHR